MTRGTPAYAQIDFLERRCAELQDKVWELQSWKNEAHNTLKTIMERGRIDGSEALMSRVGSLISRGDKL